MSSGRYWIRLSRFLTMAASWLMSRAARLPRPFFMFTQTPSTGVEVRRVRGQLDDGARVLTGTNPVRY